MIRTTTAITSSKWIKSEKPEKPENEEDYKYGPQHRFYFRLVFFKMCKPAAEDSFGKSEVVIVPTAFEIVGSS